MALSKGASNFASGMRPIDDPCLNPKPGDLPVIEELVSEQGWGHVRFDGCCYDSDLLLSINGLCRKYGSAIHVNFYGHHFSGFDAAILDHLLDLKALTIQCDQVENIEYLHPYPGI